MAKKKAPTIKKTKGKKVIQIKCTGADTLPLDQMAIIQGQLKELTEKAYEQLRNRMIELGFIAPIFIWKNPKPGKYEIPNCILDGTHRKLVLERMRDEEGWEVPDLPIVWIEAKNMKEAKEKLLAITSQYARITVEGWDEFTYDLDVENIIPNISLPDFKIPDMTPTGDPDPDKAPEKKGPEQEPPSTSKGRIIHTCPSCGHEFGSPE